MAPPPPITLSAGPFSSPENTDGALDDFTTAAAPTGKRPRGRPPGSKNKTKTPTYLSVDPQDALRSHVMELSSGADIPSSLAAYARTRGRGLAVLHAVGSVSGISVRHNNSPLFLKGKMDLISLSGTILPSTASGHLSPGGLTALVSGPQGQVLGGPIEGRLVAEGTVMVMAATFATATYDKLPLEDMGPGPSPNPGPYSDPGQDSVYSDPGVFNVGSNNNNNNPYGWFVGHQNSGNGRAVYMG